MDDAQVLALIGALNLGRSPVRERQLIGITNLGGVVYRVVEVVNALDMVRLTASMNAMGYFVDTTSRDKHGQRFARIFTRRSPPTED
jgi:hypothetical protein